MQTLMALALVAALAVCYACARRAGGKSRRAGGSVVNAALFFSFLIFAPLMTTLLLAFGCKGFEDNRKYLAADLSIDCDDPGYRQMLYWAGINIVIFVVGIPLAYLIMLRRHRDALQPSAHRGGAARAASWASTSGRT